MRALSIRQPYAELILQGKKTIEYRSRLKRIIREEFYIYAARPKSDAISVRAPLTPTLARRERETGEMPTGVIVGSARISNCTRENGSYRWHLTGVKRIARLRKPVNKPQPAWFKPF